MKKMLFCLVLQLAGLSTYGQDRIFNAGIILGLNFAELEGDGVTDYFGLNTGLIATARLSGKWQVGVEFLFSQNGEYILPEFYPPVRYGNIWLNHLEVPVHIDYLIDFLPGNDRQDLNINLGIAYTRLFGYRAEDALGNEVSDQIVYDGKEAFLLQPGMIYYFTDRLGLNLKATLPTSEARLDWTLAARMIYTFSS